MEEGKTRRGPLSQIETIGLFPEPVGVIPPRVPGKLFETSPLDPPVSQEYRAGDVPGQTTIGNRYEQQKTLEDEYSNPKE